MEIKFEEPMLKRIDLNLKENIANSGEVSSDIGITFMTGVFECTVKDSKEKFTVEGYFAGRYANCVASPNARSIYPTAPLSEVMAYYG